jgi:6-pyruvoyltetrahydropterin/6-carboxytetrahydropterin synthase
MYELSQRFMFEAAHTLKRHIDTESSARIHGHTYFAEVTITGEPDARTGMIIDLGQLREHIDRVRHELDHRLLDDVKDLGAPTLESLCGFIALRLKQNASSLSAVRVWREGSGDACRLTISKSSE